MQEAAPFQILQSFRPLENQRSQMTSTSMQGQEEYIQSHPELQFKGGKFRNCSSLLEWKEKYAHEHLTHTFTLQLV